MSDRMGCEHMFQESLDYKNLDKMTESEYVICIEHLDHMLASRSRYCPVCGSPNIIKKGHSPNGAQRYACKVCGKSFIASTVPHTHVDTDKWKLFYRSYLRGMSIHQCATICDICLKTSQYMKDRLINMVRYDSAMPLTFCGELLLDVGMVE